MTPRAVLRPTFKRHSPEADIIPPEVTPALLLTSPHARRQFAAAIEESGVSLPLRPDPTDPGAILDADGALVATVTGFVRGAAGRIATQFCHALNAFGTEFRR
jgi:hypothetical protein